MAVATSKFFKVSLVLLGVSVFMSGLLPWIVADAPIIVSLSQDPEDPYNLLITIVHRDPSPEDYVDRVQLSIDEGTVTCPGTSFSLEPQEEEFTVTHSCLTPCHLSDPETPKDRRVKARARSTVDGWSDWSADTVEIIEFNSLMLLVAVVALVAVALVARKALRRHPTTDNR